ncbi:hypothetical protein Ancab_037069 [Ancistrocladus abbreviatus]
MEFFSNPKTRQRFNTREELNRYLAYAKRHLQSVPQCASATPDSRSTAIKAGSRSKARSEGKAVGKEKLRSKRTGKMKSKGKAGAKDKSKVKEIAKPNLRRKRRSEHCIQCGKIGCICFDPAN